MTPTPHSPEITAAIQRLAERAVVMAVKLRSAGLLAPRRHPHIAMRFTGFAYGERGIHFDGYTAERVAREVWWGGPVEAAAEAMREDADAAAAALRSLGANPSRLEQALSFLCTWLLLDACEGNVVAPAELERRTCLLVRSARGEPVRSWVHADLTGVALLAEPLSIVDGGYRVRLRPITREELEAEVPGEWQGVAATRIRSRPSVMIEMEREVVGHADWQRPVERATAVLSLFGVSRVHWSRAEISTDSFVDSAGAFPQMDRGAPPRTYAIRAEDAARLPRFWRALAGAIPEDFYIGPERAVVGLYGAFFNYLGVAGGMDWTGRQVAEAVRSLESLLLDGGSRNKITATLQDRASLLLAACGYDGGKVKETIRIAYEVRSHIVHGANELNARLQRRVDRCAGGLYPLLQRCLEYNRAALVATLAAGLDENGVRQAFTDRHSLQRMGDAFRDAEGHKG